MVITRNEYPRPNYRRKNWQNLNGEWEFCFDDDDIGIQNGYIFGKQFENKIIVPFAYQTAMSGINVKEMHEIMWYRKTFSLEQGIGGDGTLLCFNGVDYEATVWLNGKYIGSHENGYTAFEFDVSKYIKNSNELVVRVKDSYDTAQPRGKQYWLKETDRCWYHGGSGIWQSVWLEMSGKDRLKKTLITPDIDNNTVTFDFETLGIAEEVEAKISYKGKTVKSIKTTTDGLRTKVCAALKPEDSIDEIHYWSPDRPNLYETALSLYHGGKCVDYVETHFGMRKISIVGNQIMLNNTPFYQKLILDQGYWADSDLTPPSAEALRQDIEMAKEMGFNGARKHQKVEDPYFYYYADILGFVVWGEMPSAYNFCHKEAENILCQYTELVGQLYNYPSIIAWVPLNESWGVRKMLADSKQKDFGRSMYYLTKALDETRFVSTNDGWENVEQTDIFSIHDYITDGEDYPKKFDEANFKNVYPMARRFMGYGEEYSEKPVIVTEYGGIALRKDTNGEAWGYSANDTVEGFYNSLGKLNEGIFSCPVFCGYCYTQLTDVKQEVNGLLDEHHKPKFDHEIIKRLNLKEHYKQK